MKTTAIANWYGSNRTLAHTVGVHLGKCEWVGIPFCGGCSEIPFIKTRTGVASDLHRHLINLANVIRDERMKDALVQKLEATLYHPDELENAQRRCGAIESLTRPMPLFGEHPKHEIINPLQWAFDYFLCTWMTAGGRSGTGNEFYQAMSVRWNASGGDSCTRFRSACDSLDEWSAILRPWNFVTADAFSFLDNAKDQEGHGIYADAPWPDDGDKYKHKFTNEDQVKLAMMLASFKKSKVVIRFGDHPLIRRLYPKTYWNWSEQTSKAQSNKDVNEVLIVNR